VNCSDKHVKKFGLKITASMKWPRK
jgi:hypothetical protein